MAAIGNIYPNLIFLGIGNGYADLSTDSVNVALLGSGYTPNFDADAYWSDISSHEISGTGYTAGGIAVAGSSWVLTPANSWGVSWAGTTVFAYGQAVIPTSPNGYIYEQVAAVSTPTTGGTQPTWPTVEGQTVTDGTCIWACKGGCITVFDSDPVTWTTATFTADYAVLYDSQSGTPSSEQLLALQTFASAQSPSAQDFQVSPDPNVGWFCFSPPS